MKCLINERSPLRGLAFSLLALGLAGAATGRAQQPADQPAAQPQQGGWRRFGDPRPGQPPDAQQAQNQVPPEYRTDDRQETPRDYQIEPQGPYRQGTQRDYPVDPQGQPEYPVQSQRDYPAGPQGQPEYPVQSQNQYPAPPPPQRDYRPDGPQQQGYGPMPMIGPAVTIPAGTWVTVRVAQPLSSDRNQPGDAFSATLMQPIIVNGFVVARRGGTVAGRVAEAEKAGRVSGTSRLGLELTEMSIVDGQQIPIHTQLVGRRGDTSTGSDVAAVGTTAGVGAAIGAAAGGGFGAGMGAIAGGGAALIGVLSTRGRGTYVGPESVLTFRLANPITFSAEHSQQAFQLVGQEDYANPNQLQQRPQMRPGGPGYYGGGAPYAYGYPYYAPYPAYYGGFGYGGFGYGYGPSLFIYSGRGYYGRGYYGRR